MSNSASSSSAAAACADDAISRDERGVLLCCHEPSYRDFLAADLRAHGFRVHHAATNAEALRKLGGRSYPLVVLLENLENCATLADNALWRHFVTLTLDERTGIVVALLGQSFPTTGDETLAYALSVDLLVRYEEVAQLAELAAAAVDERHEADRHFRAARAALHDS